MTLQPPSEEARTHPLEMLDCVRAVEEVDKGMSESGSAFTARSSLGPHLQAKPLPVYVVHFNAPDWCAATVRSILASEDISVEVTVIDNGGRPLRTLPSARIVHVGRNLGYTGGMNIGLREWIDDGRHELCAISSHDVELRPDALALLVKTMYAQRAFGILSPAMMADLHEPKGTVALVEAPWVTGSFQVLRRSCISEIGLLDERFGSYFEDVELCYRARDYGWRVGTVLGATAATRGSASPDVVALSSANQVLLEIVRSRGWRKQLTRLRLLALCLRSTARSWTSRGLVRARAVRALRARTRALRASFRPSPEIRGHQAFGVRGTTTNSVSEQPNSGHETKGIR
jgi:GT2 family glycosyltransferase